MKVKTLDRILVGTGIYTVPELTAKSECFAIEWNGDCWQSVFPTKYAEHSQLHATVQDAAEYIAEVAKELVL